jgi:hypothetical protein
VNLRNLFFKVKISKYVHKVLESTFYVYDTDMLTSSIEITCVIVMKFWVSDRFANLIIIGVCAADVTLQHSLSLSSSYSHSLIHENPFAIALPCSLKTLTVFYSHSTVTTALHSIVFRKRKKSHLLMSYVLTKLLA